MTSRRENFEHDLRVHYGAADSAIQLVSELCELYEAQGALRNGADLPLDSMCPNCGPCWSRASLDEHPSHERAGISAPFIGRDYVERRICIVAINLRGGGGLQDVWYTCGKHIEAQRAGRRGVEGRAFAYGAMAYAWLVDAALRGDLPPDWKIPRREALADVWDGCAFVEAIKCAPDRKRGEPFPEMVVTCPPFLLLHELAVLRPRVILLLSRGSARDAIRPLLNVEWDHYPPEIAHPGRLERDRCQVAGQTVELFCLDHPASLRWQDSLRQLHESLALVPLGARS